MEATGHDRLRSLERELKPTAAGWFSAPHRRSRLADDRSLAQRLMQTPALAHIYERSWRPLLFPLLSAGRSGQRERARVLELLAAPSDGLVLDIGCGPGTVARAVAALLSARGAVLAVDASAAMLAVASQRQDRDRHSNLAYLLADGADLPLPDRCADAIVCLAVLHIVQSPAAVLDEIARTLKPGGRVVLLVGLARGGPLTAVIDRVGQPAGLRLFTRAEIVALLAARELVDVTIEAAGVTALVSARRASY